MQFDLMKVKELVRFQRDLNAYIDDVFKACIEAQDPPCLSDIIAGFHDGGVHIMEALDHKYKQDRDVPPEERFIWKLYCKRDEWGNPPAKGDLIKRRIQKPLDDAPGKPAKAASLSLDKLQGTYDQKWHRYNKYYTDERGCIHCEFQDAAHLISIFGIHPRTGRGGPPLSMHLQEQTTEPTTAPNGQIIHAWYHRFMEKNNADYLELPILGERTVPRKGIEPKEIVEAYYREQAEKEAKKTKSNAK